VSDYFELDRESPYMLLVADVVEGRRLPFERGDEEDMLAVVRRPRSDIPAVTHVDYSARIQTVQKDDHPTYHALIAAFKARTGTSVIVNTSFNVRGEPIVCTPYDAYRCFMRTEMDVLVLGNLLLHKGEQPAWDEPKGHDEHHDGTKTTAAHPLAGALATVFEADFRAIAAGSAFDLLGGGAAWREVIDSANREQFEIPAALDSAEPDAQAMAAAIVAQWQRTPQVDRDALRRVVAAVLDLGLKARSGKITEEVETVSDAIYVMY
jgi:carbamoyltransferase